MPRYRYTGTGPVVFTQEVVDGRTWQPSPGEEADFDHKIDHAFLLLVEQETKPVAPVKQVADKTDDAIIGEDLKES